MIGSSLLHRRVRTAGARRKQPLVLRSVGRAGTGDARLVAVALFGFNLGSDVGLFLLFLLLLFILLLL
jgi:hypothetical protein